MGRDVFGRKKIRGVHDVALQRWNVLGYKRTNKTEAKLARQRLCLCVFLGGLFLQFPSKIILATQDLIWMRIRRMGNLFTVNSKESTYGKFLGCS